MKVEKNIAAHIYMYKTVVLWNEKSYFTCSISSIKKRMTEKAMQEMDELNIKCLQVLRSIVHNEERKMPEDWATRTTEPAVKKLVPNNTKKNLLYFVKYHWSYFHVNYFTFEGYWNTSLVYRIFTTRRERWRNVCLTWLPGAKTLQKRCWVSFASCSLMQTLQCR